ncbi:MAG TPA: branched-chain amino acid ABC transporter permease [Xanthobacteraceae bacterium]|nr:branched-chain amino acid ABC transporter permease [Xanthobacteraceae bacterium]
MPGSRFAVLLMALACAACGRVTDSEQLRLCRALLPVLHAEGTEFREIRVAPAALGRSGVRIDYAAREPGQESGKESGKESGQESREARRRTYGLTCGFGGTTFERDRLDLVAVEVDGKPIGEGRLTFLRRFLAEAGPSETAAPPQHSPELSAAAAYALQQLINALALAAVYALLATAYSLIYGLIGRINLAFGEIAVLGAYGAIGGVAATVALGIADPIAGLALALAIAAALAGGWSLLVGRVVVAPLHARHRLGQPILIATAAVALSLSEFMRLTQGARERWAPPVFNQPLVLASAENFAVTVTPMQIAVALLGLAAAGAVLVLLGRTRFGRAWRAFADDPGTAALLGVNGERLFAMTFLLAGLLAGLAGWIVAAHYGNVSFSMGAMLGLKALIAAVVGGIGSVPGAFLGGVCVALIETGWSAYFDIEARDIVLFSLLIVVFVLRPGGLLGFTGPTPRDV